MLKKDYIQRYVDELSKMIAKLLQLKLNNEPEKANYELDEFGNNFLNIDLNELASTKRGTIIQKLIEQNQFELTHFKILEELLFQKLELDEKNENLKIITLEVLHYVNNVDTDFLLNRNNRIKQLS
jgi:hypothetical protein